MPGRDHIAGALSPGPPRGAPGPAALALSPGTALRGTSARFCSCYAGKRPVALVLSPNMARSGLLAPAGEALGALPEVPPHAPHGARCAPDNLRAAQARAGSWLLTAQLSWRS